MTEPGISHLTHEQGRVARLVRAGIVTGISDGLFSTILAVFVYHSTAGRLWRGVASVLLGPKALEGGRRDALIGLAMHFFTAFWWSFVFVFVVMGLPRVRRTLASPFGVLKVASLYGPFIWIVMSFIVIPLLVHRPPTITARWWVQFVGHIPFVGLPIVSMSRGKNI